MGIDPKNPVYDVPGFPAEAELDQILRRFPFGYGIGPEAAHNPDGTYEARVYGLGMIRIPCGTFVSIPVAYGATVPVARAFVAKRLRTLRLGRRCPKFPRLRQRQPWRWPDDAENVRRWRELQRSLGIVAAEEVPS